jgi:protease PrsW
MTASPEANAAVADLRKKHLRLWGAFAVIVALGAISWATGSIGIETTFVLAVAPCFYILWHFHHADKYKEESFGLLAGTFVLGGALAFVAGLIEPDLPKNAGAVATFFYFLLGVGFIEELMKFVAVRIYSYRSVHFDESMDGVIFGITAAIGFATVENIGYVFQYGGAVALFRAFVSVPGHAFYGAIMGYFLGEAKVKRKPWLAVWGIAVATFFHGVFDSLSAAPGLVAAIAMPALVWILYYTVVKKEIQKAQSESKYAPAAAAPPGGGATA